MLPHNMIITAEFERQNRDHIQQAAEDSRKLRRCAGKETTTQAIPAQKPVFSMDWLKQLRTKPAD